MDKRKLFQAFLRVSAVASLGVGGSPGYKANYKKNPLGGEGYLIHQEMLPAQRQPVS